MAEQNKVRSPLGVLIIHGFSATHESVQVLLKPLRELGIPISLPILAGHGASSPEALRGLKWDAWMADAEQALEELLLQAERIIVVGHSMGALLSLNLAVRRPGKVDSLVLAAPAIKLVSVLAPGRPLHFAARFVSFFVKNWGLKSVFSGEHSLNTMLHYEWAPTDAIISFFELIKKIRPLLGSVRVPVLILHGCRENTVRPESASILYHQIATDASAKSILWLKRSGHQLFCDCERETAVQAIIEFISRRIERT